MCLSSAPAPAPTVPPPPPPVQIQPSNLSPQVKRARSGVAARQQAAGLSEQTTATSKQGLVSSNENSVKSLLGT